MAAAVLGYVLACGRRRGQSALRSIEMIIVVADVAYFIRAASQETGAESAPVS